MIVDLPETYVAFVLSKASQAPTKNDQEKLRLRTIDYLQQRLKAQFPSLQRIQLDFGASEFQTNKPEPRFNLYLEAQATAYFDSGGTLPDKNDVFERFVSAFGRDYLLQTVRTLDSSSPLASAVEVQARRLKRATAGGAVKAPAFYMAFACSQDPSEPTRAEQDKMLEKAHTEATKLLRQEFPDDFDELALKIVRAAIGPAAGKPEAKYNLYVEFEAVAKFTKNAPQPMDVFRVISDCLSVEFMMGLMAIGGCFVYITQMIVRVCIFIEVPELEDGEGEGELEPIIVKVRLEFFVALVIRLLGVMPNPNHLAEFDQAMQEFFSNALSKSFPQGFVDMELEASPAFGAGLPLPRFNMLHQYNATLQFYHPPPDGMKILQKITRCNVGALFDRIKGLSGPWSDTTEATMGKAVEKPATDESYGGKLELEEEKKDEVPKIEEKKPPPTTPTPKPAKKKPQKRIQKPVPKPVPEPPSVPVEETVSVGTSDVFVAFTMPSCEMEPYNREYKALAATTRDFYASHLKKKFESFRDVDVAVSRTYFGQDKPNNRYNVYLEWDIKAYFEVGTGIEAPSRYQLCRSLVETDLLTYLTKHVRALRDTPFEGAIGMFTEQVNS